MNSVTTTGYFNPTDSTTTDNVTITTGTTTGVCGKWVWVEDHDAACPNCGRCPTCGKKAKKRAKVAFGHWEWQPGIVWSQSWPWTYGGSTWTTGGSMGSGSTSSATTE